MYLEILTEEPSAEAALQILIPKIIGLKNTHKIHPHQGKQDLLAKLEARLRGYKHWLPKDHKIVVLIDEDGQDCHQLKDQLEQAAQRAGLITKTVAGPGKSFQILNRLAVEELESWFLGDPEAVAAAYPKVPPDFGQRSKFRNPDKITGGTWEALEKLLQKYGYHRGGLAKITAAREISVHMNPDRNQSKSFQVFRDGLLKLIS